MQFIVDQAGIKKYAFAKKCGVHRNMVHHWLRGEGEPPINILRKIKEHYPWVDLNWLITGNDKSYQPKRKKTLTKNNNP